VGIRDDDEEGLAEVFAGIARQLQAESTPDATLKRITSVAVRIVEGCDHAGISIVHRGGRIETPVASDGVPTAVDAVQHETGQGPCLESIQEHESYLIDDVTTESRWPDFSRRATAETGVRSMLSMRLFVQEDTIGALNLHSHSTHAFDGHARAVAAVLAAHAAVAIIHSREREQAENLQQALATNREIGIAVGIVMARDRTTREQAFDQLRHASQQLNIKLREVATRVADTGQSPLHGP
jgi:GAF domain-containing protein